MSSGNGPVTVEINHLPYETKVIARNHALRADEPGDLGGHNTGPTPYELLLGAVGACKAITAKMYADRKGWPLTKVRVDLSHDRPHGRGGPELITAVLTFEGDLDDEQRERLLEIAEKCPVQKTITGDLSVQSSME